MGDSYVVSRDVHRAFIEFQVWVQDDGTGVVVWDRGEHVWRRVGSARVTDGTSPDERAAVIADEQRIAAKIIREVFPVVADAPAVNGSIRLARTRPWSLLRALLTGALQALDAADTPEITVSRERTP